MNTQVPGDIDISRRLDGHALCVISSDYQRCGVRGTKKVLSRISPGVAELRPDIRANSTGWLAKEIS